MVLGSAGAADDDTLPWLGAERARPARSIELDVPCWASASGPAAGQARDRWIPGDGRARTNPVHPIEVAEVCVDALDRTDHVSLPIGGPEVLTREQIVRLAFAAVGRPARILHLPRRAVDAVATAVHPVHPDLGEVLEFGPAAFTHDFVAPLRGRRRLAEHFARIAGADRAAAPV